MKRFIISIFLLFSILYEFSAQDLIKEDSALSWNFTDNNKYIYSYTISGTSVIQFEKNGSPMRQKVEGYGKLEVISKNNQTADIQLKFDSLEIAIYDENGNIDEVSSETFGLQITQGLKENGEFVNEYHQVQYDLLFALPETKSIGKISRIKMDFPFSANGSSLISSGYDEISYVKNENYNGANCALLNSEFNISNLNLSNEIANQYEYSTVGQGTYYFNLERNCIEKSEIDIKKVTKIETDENENGMYVMTSEDSKIEIVLIKIE